MLGRGKRRKAISDARRCCLLPSFALGALSQERRRQPRHREAREGRDPPGSGAGGQLAGQEKERGAAERWEEGGVREGEPKGERAERWSGQTRRLRKQGPEERGVREVSPALPAEEGQGRASRRMQGMEGEEASETAAQHLAAARPPGTPRQPSPGGGRASAALPATPPLPDVHPAPPGPAPPPFLPAGTCPTPASSSVPVRRRSQDPAVPATPRGHTAPSPLASPSSDGLPQGGLGERSVRVHKWGTFPSVALCCPSPDQARASSSPGPRRPGQGGAGPPHPGQHFPLHPPCPESLWIPPSPGQGVPIARLRQIAG